MDGFLPKDTENLRLPKLPTTRRRSSLSSMSSVNITRTSLPKTPLYAQYPIANRILDIFNDPIALNGALKAVIFSYGARSGLSRGTITEAASLSLMNRSNVRAWFCRTGGNELTFNSLHSAMFSNISNNRSLVSVDLYINHMLPAFANTLRRLAKSRSETYSLRMLHEAIILPLFQLRCPKKCDNGGFILADFTAANRGYFCKRFESLFKTESLERVDWFRKHCLSKLNKKAHCDSQHTPSYKFY